MANLAHSPKRLLDMPKKSPLKMVSPIIKKYSTHRQSKLMKNFKFTRGINSKRKMQVLSERKRREESVNKTQVIDTPKDKVSEDHTECQVQAQIKTEEESCSPSNENIPVTMTADSKVLSPSSSHRNKQLSGSSKKKAMKQYKNIEATLAVINGDDPAELEKQESSYALNYFIKVRECLENTDNQLFQDFVTLISSFQEKGITVIDLYKQVEKLFINHPELIEEFLIFLSPEQALACGKFMEHLMLTKMIDFLHSVDVVFSKSPHHIRRIQTVLTNLSMKPGVTLDSIRDVILPLLKGNTLLADYFLQLLPNGSPPSCMMTDFEEIKYSHLKCKTEEYDEMETVELNDTDDDKWGSDNCPCHCHNKDDEKFRTHVVHCIQCSTKYINGKVFLQVGKILKPAKVIFGDHDITFHKKRLAPKSASKTDNSKLNNTNPDELKSDFEDDDKMKPARSPKKPRMPPKKKEKCSKQLFFGDSTIVDSVKSPPETKCFADEKLFPFSFDFNIKKKVDVEKLKHEVIQSSHDFKVPVEESTGNSSMKFFDMQLDNSRDMPTLFSFTEEASVTQLRRQEQEVIPKKEILETESTFKSLENSSNSSRNKSPPVLSIPESDSISSIIPQSANPIISMLEEIDCTSKPEEKSEVKIEPLESPEDTQVDTQKSNVEVEETVLELKINPWKIEEDRIILQTLQVEPNCEETFVKIADKIATRTIDEIKNRFQTLMSILYEMKGSAESSSSTVD